MVTCTKSYVSYTNCTVTFSEPEIPLQTHSKNYQILVTFSIVLRFFFTVDYIVFSLVVMTGKN